MSAPGRRFQPRSFAFNRFTPQQPLVTAPVTARTPLCPELAHSTRVDARKHVNASVCAVAARIPLALLTLTAEEPQVPLQQPAGGNVSHLQPDAVGSVLFGMLMPGWIS